MGESLELKNTLAAVLANVQNISEENRANKEEAIKLGMDFIHCRH